MVRQYLRTLLKRALDSRDNAAAAPLVKLIFTFPFGDEEVAELQRRTDSAREHPLDALAQMAKARGIRRDAEPDRVATAAWLKRRLHQEHAFRSFETTDPDTLVEWNRAADIARSVRAMRGRHSEGMPLPVLLVGETGCGKDVLARAMHWVASGERADAVANEAKGYIAVNCAALPKTLIESELFGYAENAFTGASSKGRPGLFEQHKAGTVLLDEIGDAPRSVQVKLLRFLNDGEVRRVGASAAERVHPWIMTATHRDLRSAVAKEKFRADLYERMAGATIRLKPLRSRGEDAQAALLARIRHHAASADMEINSGAVVDDAIECFPWPGNLRQLDMVARRIVLERELHGRSYVTLDLEDLPLEIQRHYIARTPMMHQLKAQYRASKSSLTPTALAERRQEIRESWIERLERGEEPVARVAQLIRRLVSTSFVRSLAGGEHVRIALAIEQMVDRITDEQIAQLDDALTEVDGVPGPARGTGHALEAPVPSWLKTLVQLLEVACRTPAFVEIGDDIQAGLAEIPPAWRRALEPLLLALFEDAADPVGLDPDVGEDDGVFEPWDVLKDDAEKLKAAVQRARSAVALGKAINVSERTIRDRLKHFGVDLRSLTRSAFRKDSGSEGGADPEDQAGADP